MIRRDVRATFKRPGLGAFGSLDSSQVDRLNRAVALAQANAAEAQARAPGWLQTGWATLIGAGSTTSAMNEDVRQTVKLAQVVTDKRNKLVADPGADEADVVDLERTAGATSIESLVAVDQQLSPSAFYDQVVAQSASDLGNAIANPFGIPLWVWGAGAVALLAVVYLPRRR